MAWCILDYIHLFNRKIPKLADDGTHNSRSSPLRFQKDGTRRTNDSSTSNIALRTAEDIRGAVKTFEQNPWTDSLVSITDFPHTILGNEDRNRRLKPSDQNTLMRI